MDPIDQYADDLLARASRAAESFRRFGQQQVDRIVQAVFEAAFAARLDLARLAYDETRIGVLAHKVVKNAWASLPGGDGLAMRPLRSPREPARAWSSDEGHDAQPARAGLARTGTEGVAKGDCEVCRTGDRSDILCAGPR